MPPPLRLTLTDYLDPTRWRWVLSDGSGRFLADHNVRLDPTSREYKGFVDLSSYLDYYTPIDPPVKQLAELGAWMGEKVFGGLRDAFWKNKALPAAAVHVVVPPAAQELLFRPFELARFANDQQFKGQSFRAAGLRFVYALEGTADGSAGKEPLCVAKVIDVKFTIPDQVC